MCERDSRDLRGEGEGKERFGSPTETDAAGESMRQTTIDNSVGVSVNENDLAAGLFNEIPATPPHLRLPRSPSCLSLLLLAFENVNTGSLRGIPTRRRATESPVSAVVKPIDQESTL